MTGDRQPDREKQANSSRRRLVTVAALTPVLAGAGTMGFRAARGPEPGERPLIKPVSTTPADWQEVDQALAAKGRVAGKSVYRVGFPRHDLKVTSQGVAVDPNIGIGSYLSFIRYSDDRTMLMGDMAVTDGELECLIDTLQEHGIGQTAIHKHLLAHEPAVWWTHVHAIGSHTALARGVRAALKTTGTPAWSQLKRKTPGDLDTAGISEAMGVRGGNEGKIFKFTFARRETIVDHDRLLPKGSGATTAISFQPLGNKRAAVNGDFVLIADEVQHVIRALRRGGIDVVSLHSHMLHENPRLFYLHYWGVGDGVKLARGLRAAVKVTNVAASGLSDPS
ncbi:DUF1259 domain-containing protein [Streptomyces sp. NPDC052396]|uniref:DUF1259 domain-containing protein n=1 Tax=Streptomyces sp. NPDC052396 TaxID=3365689 RepID=UPI0037CD9DA8